MQRAIALRIWTPTGDLYKRMSPLVIVMSNVRQMKEAIAFLWRVYLKFELAIASTGCVEPYLATQTRKSSQMLSTISVSLYIDRATPPTSPTSWVLVLPLEIIHYCQRLQALSFKAFGIPYRFVPIQPVAPRWSSLIGLWQIGLNLFTSEILMYSIWIASVALLVPGMVGWDFAYRMER